MENLISAERLRQLLDYDPATGVFTWADMRGTQTRHRVGSIAGCKVPHGYIKIRVDTQLHYAHRLAWLYMTGKWPEKMVDHINGIRDDNRIENLRDVVPWLNTYNSEVAKKRSGEFHGVTFFQPLQKWRAGIRINKKQIWLGMYDTKAEAIAARLAGEKILYSEVVATNKNGGRSPR